MKDKSGYFAVTRRWQILSVLVLLSQPLFIQEADSLETTLHITATVLPRSEVRLLQQPSAILITKQDIIRGYVDAESPVLLSVRNNSRSGCLAEITISDLPVKEVIVGTMGRTISMRLPGGLIPLQVLGQQEVSFAFRFILAKDTQPGNYGWQIQLSVYPM